jgi:hypothetical protein
MSAKKIIVLLLFAGIAAAGAFASGNRENKAETVRPDRQRPPRSEAPELSEETITVTGQLYFDNRMHPELKSDGEDYELLVPRFYIQDLDLEEGQTVTVEGYTVEGMPCCEEEDGEELHILVTKAVIDGVEYELERSPRTDHRWGMGPGKSSHRGMMDPDRRPYVHEEDSD